MTDGWVRLAVRCVLVATMRKKAEPLIRAQEKGRRSALLGGNNGIGVVAVHRNAVQTMDTGAYVCAGCVLGASCAPGIDPMAVLNATGDLRPPSIPGFPVYSNFEVYFVVVKYAAFLTRCIPTFNCWVAQPTAGVYSQG